MSVCRACWTVYGRLVPSWIRSLQESLEWPGLLQPSQLPLVTVPVLAVGVVASFFALLAVTVDPLVTCPPMRLVSAVSRSHLCMMLATISHSLTRVAALIMVVRSR